jgi:hypothetical protein
VPDGAVEAFGVIAISTMVFSYAMEQRHTAYLALFTIGCAMAATYAFFIGSYPFLVAESLWALIALRRWIAAQ